MLGKRQASVAVIGGRRCHRECSRRPPSCGRGQHPPREADIMAQSPSSSAPVIRDIIAARVSRRDLLKGGLGAGALLAGGSFVGSLFAGQSHAAAAQSTLGFTELKRVYDKTHAVAEGYETLDRRALGRRARCRPAGIRRQQGLRRGAGEAVRLQLRLHRLHAAAEGLDQFRPRPAVRQQRVHLAERDVSRA